MSGLWLCLGREWVAGQSSTSRGPGLGRVLGAPVHPAASTQLAGAPEAFATSLGRTRPWPAPNNEIKATRARLRDRCFHQKGNCWRRTQPRRIQRWLSTDAAVQMLTFICLLAVVSAAAEICKGLNGIVTFHNPHRGPLVEHPRAPLSF